MSKTCEHEYGLVENQIKGQTEISNRGRDGGARQGCRMVCQFLMTGFCGEGGEEYVHTRTLQLGIASNYVC